MKTLKAVKHCHICKGNYHSSSITPLSKTSIVCQHQFCLHGLVARFLEADSAHRVLSVRPGMETAKGTATWLLAGTNQSILQREGGLIAGGGSEEWAR